MEDPFPNQSKNMKKKNTKSLPPKRGEVKAQIFKSIAEGISSSMTSLFGTRAGGGSTSTSAASTAAPPSPSGGGFANSGS